MRCVGLSACELFPDSPVVLCSNSQRATRTLEQQHPGRAGHILNSATLCRYSNRSRKNLSFTGFFLTCSRPVLDILYSLFFLVYSCILMWGRTSLRYIKGTT